MNSSVFYSLLYGIPQPFYQNVSKKVLNILIQCKNKQPSYLAHNVPDLLSMEDVRGVNDCGVCGSVMLSILLVLGLENKLTSNQCIVEILVLIVEGITSEILK